MTAVSSVRVCALLSGRVLRRSLRMPAVLMQTIGVPIGTLFLLLAVFGEVVPATGVDRDGYTDRLVVLMVLSAAVSGGLGSGAALIAERREGLLARFRSLPLPRSAPLAGRVLGDLGRSLIGAGALVAAGYLIGFRFTAGPLGALGFFAVAGLYASGFCWLVTAVAMRARSFESLNALNPVFVLLLFLNSALVPVDAFPSVLQPFVRFAPHSGAVDALVGLSRGGAVLEPFLLVLVWTGLFTVVFAPLAVRSFRKASLA